MRRNLVVGGPPGIRKVGAASVERLGGVGFKEGSNGLEAIEALTREVINLMILDLNMPDMHGFEVLQFVRGHERYRAIPIIVLTTKYDAESRKAALDGGASQYITKPFDPAALREHVSTLLEAT